MSSIWRSNSIMTVANKILYENACELSIISCQIKHKNCERFLTLIKMSRHIISLQVMYIVRSSQNYDLWPRHVTKVYTCNQKFTSCVIRVRYIHYAHLIWIETNECFVINHSWFLTWNISCTFFLIQNKTHGFTMMRVVFF